MTLTTFKLGCLAGSLALLLFCPPLEAQEAAPPSPNGSDTSTTFGAGKGIARFFSQPLHPVIQPVASGGGLGAGIGYTFPTSERWDVNTKAVITPRKYWLAQFDGVYRARRGEAGAYARVRNMTRLNFFGSGANTVIADRSTFAMRDPVVGIFSSIRVLPAMELGGRVEELWIHLDRGQDETLPSVEQRFGDFEAPGLDRQPRFARYQAFVEGIAPAGTRLSMNQGGRYRITYDIYQDQELGRYSFNRLQLEGRHTFAGFRPDHSISFHGWISSAEAKDGQQVPFFLQHTLGGTSNLRSLHEDPVGGDGTPGTLRGFQNLRFRDDHLMLLQAEYRFGVWGPLDATVFADAGKAVRNRSELSLADLKRDYGFSLSMMRGAATVARVDVGFGGGEGRRIFVGLGGLLP